MNGCSMGTSQDLIPGLPDDIGLGILARVPRRYHASSMAGVSSAWRAALVSPLFYEERKRIHCTESWVYAAVLCQVEEDQRLTLSWFAASAQAAETEGSSKWRLPTMPPSHAPLHGFQSAVIGNLLYVIGGFEASSFMARDSQATSKVSVFNAQTNKWSSVAEMERPRANFACGVIDGLLYVAGGETSVDWICNNSWPVDMSGESTSSQIPLSSAEVFDPATGRWSSLPPMLYSKHLTFGIVEDGKFLVSGFRSREYLQFEEITEAYETSTGRWKLEELPINVCCYSSSSANMEHDGEVKPCDRLRNLRLPWRSDELIVLGDSLNIFCIEMGDNESEDDCDASCRDPDFEGTPLLCELMEV